MSTDTREALAALMAIAAECAQRKPLRGFEELTEATHIGHRQFRRAHERADEDVRMLAVRLRAVFDTLAAALATQPAQPSRAKKMREAGFTARDTRLTCDECGAKFTQQFAPLHECAQPAQPSAAQMPEPYEAVEQQIVGRFRVEKRSGGGFWPYCVKAGDGTMELFIGHKTKCEEVAQALQTACLDGAFMASKAAQPSAQQAVPLPGPAHRERVYAGHGNEDVYEWYTVSQMREHEAAVIAACAQRCEEQAARWADDRAVYVAHECARVLRAGQHLAAQPSAQGEAVAHTSERHFALREAHCIAAGEAYWKARHGTYSAARSIAFDAGFARGFDAGEKVYYTAQPVAVPAGVRAFLEEVATQKPSKPDYWSSCGQCEHNQSKAEDLLAASPQPGHAGALTDEQIESVMNQCHDSDMARAYRREFLESFKRIYFRLHPERGIAPKAAQEKP